MMTTHTTRFMHARRSQAGQAMIELAIFGTFLLFALVLIVRFGMTFYSQLQTTQEAFRLALKQAYETRAYDGVPGERGSLRDPDGPGPLGPGAHFSPTNQGQVVLVRDRYIPDPSNAFAAGVPIQTVGAGTVVWGSDSAEFEPHPDYKLPELLAQVNDTALPLQMARFRTEVLPFGPGLAAQLCLYDKVYGTLFVDFLDSEGQEIEGKVDFKPCPTSGQATITIKRPERDPEGPGTPEPEDPPLARLEIVDTCMGDFLDLKKCTQQCKDIQANALWVPIYCNLPPIKPFDPAVRQGLDLANFTRTHTVNNSLRRREDRDKVQAETTVNETTRVGRKIWTNQMVTPRSRTQQDERGRPYIDATTSVSRTRRHTWTTNW